MEVDEIQTQNQTQTPQQQPCKYSRVNSNGRIDSSKLGQGGGGPGGGGGSNGGTHNHSNNEMVGPTTTALATASAARAMTGGGGLLGGEMVVGSNGTNSRFGRQWQHSSRIIRVSRASGGKDRHSKVWTAKGPRDRRVRLSVTTAIQFYDLQDRLGYDQPSKAVDWLIKAASEAINELPSLNTASFPPETPRQLSDERKSGGCNNGMVDDPGDAELVDGEINLGQDNQQQQQQMGSKSGCSSNNSETSKGSGLSLWRSENRVKARERARERTAKEKERDAEPSSLLNVAASHQQQHQHQQQNVSSMAQTSSFTQLLTAGMSNLNESNNGGAASSSPSAEMGLFHKHSRGAGSGGGGSNNNNNNQWLSSTTSTTQMADYFGSGLMGLISASRAGQIGLGSNTSSLPQVMTIASFGGGSENHHHQTHHDQLHQQHHNPHHHPSQQSHFPFISDQHLIQVANVAPGANGGGGGGNDYNLNFSMSSTSTTSSAALAAAAGYNNRGTLQSNSPSLLPYLQRFSAATDGSSLPFFLGSAAVSSASPTVNHHQHQFQPPGLQLCYGDGGRQSDQKGKGKN